MTSAHRSTVGAPLAFEAIVDLALSEDLLGGDVTSRATIPPETAATGTIIAKERGVISGLDVASAVFARVDPDISFHAVATDGQVVSGGDCLATAAGWACSLLASERVALNFLQRLSGVATQTARFVAAVTGTSARIVDTRKTTPGLRMLEKAAVRHGGGHNHRFNLADGVLIKDNHLAAVGGPDRVARAIQRARERSPHTLRVEVEVTTVEEVCQALDAGADIILLDNMDLTMMREAVALVDGHALVEASGGVSLQTVRAIAETGVDLISAGALTHSAPALDISLDFDLHSVSS